MDLAENRYRKNWERFLEVLKIIYIQQVMR